MTLYDNDLILIFTRSLAHLGWSTKSDGEASTIRGGGPRHQKWRSTDREFTKANILFDLGAEIAEMKRSLEARAKSAPKRSNAINGIVWPFKRSKLVFT